MDPTKLTPPPDGDVILSNGFIAGIAIMTVLAVSTVWLRMYNRIFVSRNAGSDDWTMLAASIVTIVTNTFLISAYHHGLGRHIYYLKPEDISETFMWLWAAEPTNLFAVSLARLSICLFFLRLIPRKRIYLWTIRGTIAGLIASDIYVSINYFFECVPIRKVWEPATPGKCLPKGVNVTAVWLFQAVSMLADISLLFIPIHLFWRLQVEMRIRIALIFICCLGIFTFACAIVKTVLLLNLFSADPDKTWVDAQFCLWAPLELCVGMIGGSIPTLRPLFKSDPKSSGEQDRPARSMPLLYSKPSANELSWRNPTVLLTSNANRSYVSRSSSEDGITVAYNFQQTQQTFEEESNNKAAECTARGGRA